IPVAKSTLAAKEAAVMGPLLAVLRNTDTVLLPLLATARSGLPSPSRSPIATLTGTLPVAKSTLAVKEATVMEPLLAILRKTDSVLSLKLATARSGLPSPSKSPIATLSGSLPVTKSTLAAKDEAVMEPLADVLRNIDTVLLLWLTTARSGLPSPSRSPIATLTGVVPVAKSTLAAISAVVMLPLFGVKVHANGAAEYPAKAVAPFNTDMGW